MKVVIEFIIGVQPSQHVAGPITRSVYGVRSARGRLISLDVCWISEKPNFAIPVKDPTVLVGVARYSICAWRTRLFIFTVSAVPSVERILNPRN